MKLKQITKLAAVSAVALGLASTAVQAAPNNIAAYELDSDTPITIEVVAEVDQAVSVATTDVALGQIGIHQDKSVGGTGVATLALAPDGTVVDTPLGTARLISNQEAANLLAIAPATVQIGGAFPNEIIYTHYSNPVNLVCTAGAACLANAGNPALALTGVTDGLGAAVTTTTGTFGTAGTLIADGTGTTSAAGDLDFTIGVTIATIPGPTYYASGTYTGSFDMTLSY